MSSFYGCGCGRGGSGGQGGTSSNSPISQITGTQASITILGGLKNDIYAITGLYKNVASQTQTHQFLNNVLVTVGTDEESGNKYASFMYVKDGNIYFKLITFEGDGYVETDTLVGGSSDMIDCDCVWGQI